MCLKFVLSEIIPVPLSEDHLNPPAIFAAYDMAITTIQEGAASLDDPKLLDLSLRLFDGDAGRHTSIDTRALIASWSVRVIPSESSGLSSGCVARITVAPARASRGA